jgi:hypothetical protein
METAEPAMESSKNRKSRTSDSAELAKGIEEKRKMNAKEKKKSKT